MSRGDVTGVRIVLNGLSDERAFSAAAGRTVAATAGARAVARIVLTGGCGRRGCERGRGEHFLAAARQARRRPPDRDLPPDARVLADFKNAARKVDLVARCAARR